MKRLISIFITTFLVLTLHAQVQDPKSPAFDLGIAADTTKPAQSVDTTVGAAAKPYERITLYVDSVTNLISYLGVVEQEESGSDSLYTRAKRWAYYRFGGVKSLYLVDKKNQKLVMRGWMPAQAYTNKYTRRNIGRYEFKMTIWIKEGRYKYQLTNFVHEGVRSAEGLATRNYFEFYYTSPNNVRGYDQSLRYANHDITKLIEDFKKHMKDPIVVDEEEW